MKNRNTYITLSNTLRIVNNSNLSNVDVRKKIFKKPIYFLNRLERARLLSIKELFLDSEKYFSEIYTPIEFNEDSDYIYIGGNPCYHNSPNCKRLNSDFKNYRIPEDIIQKGKKDEFRKWFTSPSIQTLLKDNPQIFAVRLQARWGINTNPKAIYFENSGYSIFDNFNIDELKNNIYSLIKRAGRFYYATEKNKKCSSRY